MLPEERQKAIGSYLAQKGFASVAELCERFSVSEMTVRRDLDVLQEQGILRRTYGGAAPAEAAFFEVSLLAKMKEFVQEKERIGAAAAGMVRDGQTVLLSGGSTCHQVAKHLKKRRISVVTNAINIASELVSGPHIRTLVAGGILLPGPACLVGPQAVAFLKEVQADVLFLGVEGISVEGGPTLPDVIEADTDRAMMASARRTVVVADHSKLGRNALIAIAPLNRIDLIITGSESDEAAVEELKRHVQVQLV